MRARRLLPAMVLWAVSAPAAAVTWTSPAAANPDMPRRPPSPSPSPPPSQWPPLQWPPQWPVPQWPPVQPAPPTQPAPPVQPAPAPWPAGPQPEYLSPSIISLGLGFFVDVGSLPDVAPGMQVWMGLITERFRVEMVTDYFSDPHDPDGEFRVLGIGGRFCGRFLPWKYRAFRKGPGFSLWGCGGFEVGWISFYLEEQDPSSGSRTLTRQSDTWGAARAELEGRYQIARSIAALLVQAGVAVPFGQPELVGPADDPFRHSPSPVVGRFGVAFALGY